ncbi:iron-sulfur cluster assembly accessory protein [Onchocerca flexuosa]|uniref:Iron-sulfur cluster assembly 1 homolog, mitochondrial n=1 Tax=Onchocerca flexuosa TaxID=387005 RepID=A0A238BL18_9BILA|nr:iron-sulfur cluster assembly accessory protein [Onchocerca flexuosa]
MNGDALEELLVCEGWPIDGNQLSDFMGEPIPRIQDVNQLKKQLLDADMREYALPLLSDRINKQLGEFKGPLIVQVIKQRNVSYPKYSETVHTDGLIKIQLSDGFSSIQALLFEPIPKLNAGTPPGTKVRLIGKIPIENGMLLINETNCQVLGGNVEKMVEKWNLEKVSFSIFIRRKEIGYTNQYESLITMLRNGSNFLSSLFFFFFFQRLLQSSLPLNATNKMFRANDVINGLSKKMTDERGDDFNAARKAQIEQVIGNNAIKKFARSQLKPKSFENSASTSWNNSNKRDSIIKAKPDMENRNRRFVRDDKKNLSPVHRLSNPLTLYDFVQPKVSIPDKPPCQQNFDKDQVKRTEANMQNAEIQRMNRSQRSRFNEKASTSEFSNRQISENNTGLRTIEISNSKRYRKQFNRSGRERDCTIDVMNDKSRSDYADSYQLVTATSKDVDEDHNILQPTVFFENKNHSYQLNAIYRPTYEQQQQQPFNNLMINGGIPFWKIGDKCLAPWNDGQFYPSTLISMGPADMCTIEYDEYGNRSSVPVGHMTSRHASTAARVIKTAIRRGVPSKVALSLTPEAVKRVKYLLSKQPETTALKISVRQRGCNGLTYTLDYAQHKAKFDEEVVQDGARLWIDPKAQLTLLGSEMDYVEDRLSSEFVFRNPNIKSTCGCGESFSI